MGFNSNTFAFASAGTMGVVSIVCTAVSWLWPDVALRLAGWLTHLVNLEQIADGGMTFGGALLGFVQAVVYGYAVGWVFAWLYNRSLAANA